MLVYNVTVKIIPAIEGDWVRWMKQEHIPDILATGHFYEGKLCRLLDQDESEGITYVAQYFTETEEKYRRYLQENAPDLRKKSFEKWGDQFIAFRTVMKIVN